MQISLIVKPFKLSRRGILAAIASIYDPLGIASQILIEGRLIFQDISSKSWDECLSDEICHRFRKWHNKLLERNTVDVDRWQGPNFEVVSVELNFFSYASNMDYYISLLSRPIKINKSRNLFTYIS